MPSPDLEQNPTPEARLTSIALCHTVLRAMTGVIMGAFLLIILLTTLSTGPFVQFVGKTLYYLILLAAIVSLGTWMWRVRLERKMGKETDVAAEILKKV
jgi:hypothetical protein